MEVKHLNLIRKIAWSFHRTTGLEWDELFAEASYAYCCAIRAYDEDKGNLIKWLSGFLNKHLISFVEKEMRDKFLSLDESWIDRPYNPTPFFEIFDAMTKDVQEIATMVLLDPYVYLEVSPKIARGIICRNLVREKQWTWTRAWAGMRNIKIAIKETC